MEDKPEVRFFLNIKLTMNKINTEVSKIWVLESNIGFYFILNHGVDSNFNLQE